MRDAEAARGEGPKNHGRSIARKPQSSKFFAWPKYANRDLLLSSKHAHLTCSCKQAYCPGMDHREFAARGGKAAAAKGTAVERAALARKAARARWGPPRQVTVTLVRDVAAVLPDDECSRRHTCPALRNQDASRSRSA
jgi:hypothetical protein